MSWIKDNWGLKLLSLMVAVLLWLATVGEPESATVIAVPVQYRNIPANLEVSSEMRESAYVEVRGPSGRLSGANLANTVVLVDLAGQQRPGERTYSIQEDNVRLPPGVQFLRAVPAQIRIRLEYQVSREVPVVVRYSGPAPDGLRIARQEVAPQLVRILGPESRVSAIDRVQTDPIELAAVEGVQTFQAHPYSGDPQVRLVKSDLMVTIKVGLEKADRKTDRE
ncbi:MAG: YbbR-like domain-containing protein [Bryobacterales bacterium]|nr:YbbR-like domain-containing protein [Bryobacterales bacterium]